MAVRRNGPCPCGRRNENNKPIKAKACCYGPPPPKPQGWSVSIADVDDMTTEELRQWALGKLDPDGESWFFPPTDGEGKWYWFETGHAAAAYAKQFYPGRAYFVFPIDDLRKVASVIRREPFTIETRATVRPNVFTKRRMVG